MKAGKSSAQPAKGRCQKGEKQRLTSIDGSEPRDFCLVKRKVNIGSGPQNDLTLDHKTVSQRHAKLTRRFGKYWLADLGSTNGTFVNGKPLIGRGIAS